MRLDKEQYKIINELCEKYSLTKEEVFDMIKAPMKFIRMKTAEIEIDESWTEEEFHKETYNFNIPSIGKLYASYNNFKRIKDARKRKRHKRSDKEKESRKE